MSSLRALPRRMSVLFLLGLAVLVPSDSRSLGAEGPKVAELSATPFHVVNETGTDFDYYLGGGHTEWHMAFVVNCSGAVSTTVTVSHTNPQFVYSTPFTVTCGQPLEVEGYFTPSAVGQTFDDVTLVSALGQTTIQLVGNGVVLETPDQYLVDLPEGTSAGRLVYDDQRDLVYLSDFHSDRVLVFSPAAHQVVATIPVGHKPYGLGITPNHQKLYLALTAESGVSEVDLNTWQESRRIHLSQLGPEPGFYPYDIAVYSDTHAFFGCGHPGGASAIDAFQLDLVTGVATPRGDFGWADYPDWRTSRNYAAVIGMLTPGYSTNQARWYDTATGELRRGGWEEVYRVAINAAGTRMVTSEGAYSARRDLDLSLHDAQLRHLGSIPLLGLLPYAMDFSPAAPLYVYSVPSWSPYNLEESSTFSLRQTRALRLTYPADYYAMPDALTMSDDGLQAYVIFGQTWNDPPSKLVVVNLGGLPGDIDPPISALDMLPPAQSQNGWAVAWSGADDYTGIAYYQVQVRAGDSGSWTDWLTTPATRAFFADALPGRTYYFRSRAVDLGGRVEPYPPLPETYTRAGFEPYYEVFLPLAGRSNASR